MSELGAQSLELTTEKEPPDGRTIQEECITPHTPRITMVRFYPFQTTGSMHRDA